ncbi:hypothetical protein ACTFIT_003616 [Dictyostelium discoideum]
MQLQAKGEKPSEYEKGKKKEEFWKFDFSLYSVHIIKIMKFLENLVLWFEINKKYFKNYVIVKEQFKQIKNTYSLVAKNHKVNPTFIEKEIARYNNENSMYIIIVHKDFVFVLKTNVENSSEVFDALKNGSLYTSMLF